MQRLDGCQVCSDRFQGHQADLQSRIDEVPDAQSETKLHSWRTKLCRGSMNLHHSRSKLRPPSENTTPPLEIEGIALLPFPGRARVHLQLWGCLDADL
jgi:hypothetical protein